MSSTQKDSSGVKEALDRLSEEGWAKKWSSQPYMSRRTVYIEAYPCYNELELKNSCVFVFFCVSDIASGADNARNQERRDSCHP